MGFPEAAGAAAAVPRPELWRVGAAAGAGAAAAAARVVVPRFAETALAGPIVFLGRLDGGGSHTARRRTSLGSNITLVF